jgi:hypothetical protein
MVRSKFGCPAPRQDDPAHLDRVRSMNKYHNPEQDYLALQASIICVLLFLIGTTALIQHPAWFR